MDKITIITPVYNVEDYLKRCIESVISQTYKNWELILVDDGSPDNSGMICDEYAVKDVRIKVFHKQNGGVSSARNFALDKAKGKYVTFIDSDDWIDENCLRTCVLEMKDDKNEMLQFGFKRVSPSIGVYKEYTLKDISLDVESYIRSEAFHVCAAGSVYRLDVIQKNNIRFDADIKYAEDQIFLYTYLSKIKMIKSISNCFYNYFCNNQSSTSIKQSSNDLIKSINGLSKISDQYVIFRQKAQEQIQIFLERILVNHDMTADQYAKVFLKYYNPKIRYLRGLVLFNVFLRVNPLFAYHTYGRIFSFCHK